MDLTSKNVDRIFRDCMFENYARMNTDHVVITEGVLHDFGFDKRKITKHEADIVDMLGQLPAAFHEKSGGGMSFLNACLDRNKDQWGEHRSIEQLICLGIAIRRVRYCFTKRMWSALPGGMPYFVVTEQPIPMPEETTGKEVPK